MPPVDPSASKPTTPGHPASKTKSYAPAAAKPTVPRTPSTKDDAPPAAAKPTVPRTPSTKDDAVPAAAKPRTQGHPVSKTTGYGSSKSKGLDTPAAPSLTERFEVEPPRDYLPPPPPPPPLTPEEQATVDTAVAEVTRAAYDENNGHEIQPGAGTAALLEQIAANPALADDIAAASGEIITEITESLNDSDLPPEEVKEAVEQLATAEELTDNGAVAEAVSEGIPEGGASSTFIGSLASTPFGRKLADKTPLKQQVRQVAAVLPGITGTSNPIEGAQALQAGAASLPPNLVDALLVASSDAVNQLTGQLPQLDANAQADVTLALLETAELGTGARTDILAGALLQDGVLGEAAITELAAGDMEGKSRLVDALDEHDDHPQADDIHAARVARENTDGILQQVQDGKLTDAASLLQLVSLTSPPGVAAFVLEEVLAEGGVETILNGLPTLEPEAAGGVINSLSETVSLIGSDELTGQVADLVAAQIPERSFLGPGDLYYDTFELAISNGYGAALGGRVVESLVARGDMESANSVLEAVNSGVSLLTSDIDYQADRIDQLNGDLFYLDMHFGELKSDEDRARAAAEYVASFPDYEEIGPYGAAAIRDQEALERLDDLDLELDAAYDIEDRRAELLEQTSRPAVMQNDQARAALGEAIAGQKTWISDVPGLLQEFGDEGLKATEFFATSAVRAATERAALAVAGGDLAKARSVIDGLGGQSALFGLSPEELHGITGTLNDITAASAAQDLDEVARLQEELDGKVPKGALGTFLGFGGVVLAGAGFVGSVAELLDDPSAGKIFDTTLASGELAGALGEASVRWLPKTGELLAKAGNYVNFINIGFDTLGALGAAAEGDYAAAGLQFAGALGSTAVAVGTSSLTAGALAASLTGIGAVLVVGSAIGLYQYEKVKLSNEHENPTTEAYIRVGLEDVNNPNLDQVIYHLRDADSEGRAVGILFGQAAKSLGMSGEEFMQMIAELPPDKVLDVVHKAHGIDPQDSDDPTSLPQTHKWDEYAGTRQTGTTLGEKGLTAMSERYVDPKSVEGWIQFLRVTGVLPPA